MVPAIIVSNVDDTTGDSVTLEKMPVVNEIVKVNGELYEVVRIENDVAYLSKVEVKEDWGE